MKIGTEKCLNPYFIGLPILISPYSVVEEGFTRGLNPYFIGLPILIKLQYTKYEKLFCLNPYFIGLPILIVASFNISSSPYKVSILILLDYLFL